MRLNQLQIHIEEERQLAIQHQMALQAQVNEGQAHVKVCNDLFYVSTTAGKVKLHPENHLFC